MTIFSADTTGSRAAIADSKASAKGTYALISLGCPKNLVDSERMLGLFSLEGYELVAEPRGADFAVVNTCGFIDRAREESIESIEEMVALKREGHLRGLIVTGCLAERQREALLARIPEIDYLVGVFARDEVARVADRMLGGWDEQQMVFRPAPSRPLEDRRRVRVTPRHYAYLKISEGCDRLCTFCAIPRMRGKHATKPIEEVIAEARELAGDGVRELIIVAQDTTYYGMDLYGEPRLVELLEALQGIDGIEWIRLMYLYPMYFSDRLIEHVAESAKIVPYLDLPLQHIADRVLRRMQRRVDRRSTTELLQRLRRRIPRLALRTTMIAGFPGETEAEFAELEAFVREQRFERLGVFAYSYEPETAAVRLDGHMPDEVKETRRARLMAVQQQVAFDWNARQVGKRTDILIDSPVPGEATAWIGRSYADAPQIDSVVYVTGDQLAPGRIVPCEIVAARDYDLIAVAVGPAR